MIFSRTTLKHAFPDNPRAVAEFERLDGLLSATNDQGQTLADQLAEIAASFADGGAFQQVSDLLSAISATPQSDLGVVEKVDQSQVALRQVDSDDDTCLVSRSKLISYLGSGSTRPAPSANRRGVFFDTALATAGKPVFWTGTQWVDATGAVV